MEMKTVSVTEPAENAAPILAPLVGSVHPARALRPLDSPGPSPGIRASKALRTAPRPPPLSLLLAPRRHITFACQSGPGRLSHLA